MIFKFLEIDQESFSLFFLPEKWQKYDPSYQQLLVNLILNASTPNKIKLILNDINLPYSTEQINEIKEEILKKSSAFFNQELPNKVLTLYIDGYHCSMKMES